MGTLTAKPAQKLATHLRDLRDRHALTLADLAQRSGLSKSTLSRIESAEVSPTAETLGRLASVYALPISQLLAPMEQTFQPVIPRDVQATWRDPVHDFQRRSVSPPHGHLSIELIEGRLGARETISYAAPAIPGQEHHVYVLTGQMVLTVEGTSHALEAGDCLRYVLFGETAFRTEAQPCRYVIALS